MPGLPTLFRLVDRATSNNNPGGRIFAVDPANMPFAYLGSIGASLADFLPNGDSGDGDAPPDPTKYWRVWNEIFAVVFGYSTDPDDDTPKPSLLADLGEIQNTLKQLRLAVKNQDVGIVTNLVNSGDLEKFQNASKDLLVLVNLLSIDPGSFTDGIGQLIFDSMSMKPKTGTNRPPPANELFLRELLHWRKTGTFASRLLEGAGNDARHQAYANGYLASYAGKVCGSPFVNSIVGGPYRTQWWRHRYINNYVDSWIYGFYDETASMDGDVPNPPYADWKNNLCDAGLHDQLTKPLGKQSPFAKLQPLDVINMLRGKLKLPPDLRLPKEFCAFWSTAFKQTYDDLSPDWISGGSDDRRQIILTYAFLQLWLVLWFQTGTGVCGLGAEPPVPQESNTCGAKPVWDTIPVPPGQPPASPGPPPPVATPETETDLAETITGIVGVVLGALAYAAGQSWLGAPLIAAGCAAIANSETTEDWNQLTCNVYFYDWFYFGFCDALHKSLTMSGFSFPYANELDKTVTSTDGRVLSVGTSRIRSNGPPLFRTFKYIYPMQMPTSKPQMTAWLAYPATGLESPAAIGYLDIAYPNFFFDLPSHGLGAGNPPPRAIAEANVTLTNTHLYKDEQGSNSRTGNALDNLRYLINNTAETDLPQWNLDADRGLYFWDWEFADVYDTNNLQVADNT